MSAHWITLLNALCTLLPIVAFASPATVLLPAVAECGRRRPDAPHGPIEMAPLALTTQMLQCFLFSIYALRFSMVTLFIPNLFGFVLGLIWTAMYPFKAAPVDSLRRQWKAQTSIAAATMILGAATVRTSPHVSSAIAAAVGVLMSTYPLQSMGRAYADRNPGLMGSPAMNGAMFACTTSWVIHASPLVEYDVFVLTANGAGALVQGCALLLRVAIARGGGGGTAGGGEYEELLP